MERAIRCDQSLKVGLKGREGVGVFHDLGTKDDDHDGEITKGRFLGEIEMSGLTLGGRKTGKELNDVLTFLAEDLLVDREGLSVVIGGRDKVLVFVLDVCDAVEDVGNLDGVVSDRPTIDCEGLLVESESTIGLTQMIEGQRLIVEDLSKLWRVVPKLSSSDLKRLLKEIDGLGVVLLVRVEEGEVVEDRCDLLCVLAEDPLMKRKRRIDRDR